MTVKTKTITIIIKNIIILKAFLNFIIIYDRVFALTL